MTCLGTCSTSGLNTQRGLLQPWIPRSLCLQNQGCVVRHRRPAALGEAPSCSRNQSDSVSGFENCGKTHMHP